MFYYRVYLKYLVITYILFSFTLMPNIEASNRSVLNSSKEIPQGISEKEKNSQFMISTSPLPLYWSQFLNNLKEKPYSELLKALEDFSQNNLSGPAKDVFKDVHEPICQFGQITNWLETIKYKLFGENGKYKEEIKAEQAFTQFITAFQVWDALKHVGSSICSRVYERIKQKNESIQVAYKHLLPPQIFEKLDVTEKVSEYVIKKKVRPQVAYNELAIIIRKERYQKVFGIDEWMAKLVAKHITENNKALKEALFLSMKKPLLLEGTDIRKDLTEIMVTQQRSFQESLGEIRERVFREILSQKKFDLDESQINKILEYGKKNKDLNLGETLKASLPPIMIIIYKENRRSFQDITPLVVEFMIEKDISFPKAKKESIRHFRIKEFLERGYPEELSKNLAEFIIASQIDNFKTTLKKGLEKFLPNDFYEGKNLKLNMIKFLTENLNFKLAYAQAKQTVIKEIWESKGMLEKEAKRLAEFVVLKDISLKEGLMLILESHPRFSKNKEKFPGYLEALKIELLKNQSFEKAEQIITEEYTAKWLKNNKLDFLDTTEISNFIFKAGENFERSFQAYVTFKAPNIEKKDQENFLNFLKKHWQKNIKSGEKIFLLDKYREQFLKKFPSLKKERGQEVARLIVEKHYEQDRIQDLLTMAFQKIDGLDMEVATGVAKILISMPEIPSISHAKDKYYMGCKIFELQKKYPRLEKEICERIAEHMHGGLDITVEIFLNEIFKKYDIGEKNFSEAQEMILFNNKSLEEVQATFGFAPILQLYPTFEKEEAKTIASLIWKYKKSVINQEDVKWGIFKFAHEIYKYGKDFKTFFDFFQRIEFDWPASRKIIEGINEKIKEVKKMPYFFKIINKEKQDDDLLGYIKKNNQGLNEQESHQFLWDICHEAYLAGNLVDTERGFAVYLMKRHALENMMPEFVTIHDDLKQNLYSRLAQYLIGNRANKGIKNFESVIWNSYLSEERLKKFKINFYQFIKKENSLDNLLQEFWSKYFEEGDITHLLCISWWRYDWNGERSLVPDMENILIDYYRRIKFIDFLNDSDESYVLPQVRAVVRKMIKAQDGLKFKEASDEVDKDIKNNFQLYQQKQTFLKAEFIKKFACDTYFYLFASYEEIEKGIYKDWRIRYSDCFVKFFEEEENKKPLVEYVKKVFPFDEKDLRGENLKFQIEDYVEAFSHQMEYLKPSLTVEQALETFQVWLDGKSNGLKDKYLLEEQDLKRLCWGYFINKLEIEEALRIILGNKSTPYGKITDRNAMQVACIWKNSEAPLTLEQAHRFYVINDKAIFLDLPLIRPLKKEVAVKIVDQQLSEKNALLEIMKKYPQYFPEIPKENENKVLDLVFNGMAFEAAILWTNFESKYTKEEDLIKALYKEITSKQVYEYITSAVMRYRNAVEKILEEEIHLFQAICHIHDYIQAEHTQALLSKDHEILVNTHLINLKFNLETLQKFQEIPKKTEGKFFLLDSLRQQKNVPYDCNPPKATCQKNAEDIIRAYPSIIEDPWNLDGETTAKLLRMAWGIVPTKVHTYRANFRDINNKIIVKRRKTIMERQDVFLKKDKHFNVTRERLNELREFQKTRMLDEIENGEFSNLTSILQTWKNDPNHPRYEESICTIIEKLDKRKPEKFLIHYEKIKYNPFFVIPKINQFIPEDVIHKEYQEMRDTLIDFIHNSEDLTHPLELKEAIGRWFAWADLDSHKYIETFMFFKLEDGPSRQYRKRIKNIYLNLLDPKKYKKELITHYLSILDTEILTGRCLDGAIDGLDKLEAFILGGEELLLHQRIVMAVTTQLKVILNKLSIDQKYGVRGKEDLENKLFVEMICKNHFSLPIFTEKMKYTGCGAIPLNEVESIVTDALNIVEKDLVEFIYGKMRPGAKTGKAAGYDIYLLDVIEWMKLYPKYCNEPDLLKYFVFPEEGEQQIPTFKSIRPILIDLLVDCQIIHQKKETVSDEKENHLSSL